MPHTATLSCVVEGLCKAGETENAERWIREMMSLGVCIDALAFSHVISANAARGDVEKAEACFVAMTGYKVKATPFCYNGLIHACAQAGDVARGVRWMQTMERAGFKPDEVSFATLINGCNK